MTKSLLTLLCALVLCTQSALSLWDFAVTTKTKILFFDDKWREITSSAHQFDQLSALTFDETEDVVYFNDQLHNNGSIFSLKLPTPQEDQHIIDNTVKRTQNESIVSIAYDPLNHNLFWTDRHNRKIYFVSVHADETAPPKVLVDFTNETAVPDGIAVDICRRKLYWTNSNFKNASIESINLDGRGREMIVRSDLYFPHGIVVDQLSDRLFWVVDQQGMHFSVESSNLDGSDRQVIVKGLNNVPFNLAVTKDSIFWTDVTHNAVWSHSKFALNRTQETANESETEIGEPHMVKVFHEQPRGIVSRTRFLTNLVNDEHCSNIVAKIKSRLLTPTPTLNPMDAQQKKWRREYCLNGGDFNERSSTCICPIGYDGVRCEISECHNYCVHGTCAMSAMGFPKCTCQREVYGDRCEKLKCTGYCFNGGSCLVQENGEPTCECRDYFGGQRCEQNSTEICALFCRILKYEPETYVPFGCHDICEQLVTESEDGAQMYAIPKYQHLEVCQNAVTWSSTVIIVLAVGVVACFGLVLLIVHGLRRFYKPARPRIKKTFVVRKQATSSSETPLTNRPMATEQCEITIENCCNMNICETPCFDPKLVQQSLSRDANAKEDKKMLIHNLEDELY